MIKNENTRQHREDQLDEAIEETFPASDPPANTVETGIAIGSPTRSRKDVGDDRGAQPKDPDAGS
jgi:hypothetical protein